MARKIITIALMVMLSVSLVKYLYDDALERERVEMQQEHVAARVRQRVRQKKRVAERARQWKRLLARLKARQVKRWHRYTEASAYSLDDSGWRDSEGHKVRWGLVATGRKHFKALYGKVIYIKQFPGVKFYVRDKMGADRDIDIWMPSSHKAKHWAVKRVDIRVIGETRVYNFTRW